MENITIEQIKELYPKGCKVKCAINGTESIVFNKDFKVAKVSDKNSGSKNIGVCFISPSIGPIFLFDVENQKFAEITKPAPLKTRGMKVNIDSNYYNYKSEIEKINRNFKIVLIVFIITYLLL